MSSDKLVGQRAAPSAASVGVLGLFYPEGLAQLVADEFRLLGYDVVSVEAEPRPWAIGERTHGRWLSAQRMLMGAAQNFSSVRRSWFRSICRQFDGRALTCILVCHDLLNTHEVIELRRLTGAPVVIWVPDHPASWGRARFLYAGYDRVFLKDRLLVSRVQDELGLPAVYLPECFSPRHLPVPNLSALDHDTYGCDLVLAGNLYPSRVQFLDQLSAYDVKVWGNPAPVWLPLSAKVDAMLMRRYVAYEEKAKAFLCAKIVLNNLHPAEYHSVNARTFEACGVGAFQLVSWREGLNDVFKDGVEVVAYRNLREMHELIRFYLAAPEARTKIAAAARTRSAAEHTYAHRLQKILDSATTS